MEAILMIVLPGILGGLVLALLFFRLGGSPEGPPAVGRLEPPSTSMINMARIRVTGLGGLGMVAMSITVAIFVPRIRLTMAIALFLGAGLAALLIAFRRRQGPLGPPNLPGAHSMLTLDTPRDLSSEQRLASRDHAQELSTIPARP